MFRLSPVRGKRSSSRVRTKITPKLRPWLVQLEDRCNPTFLFVDFGDAFPSGGLSDTLQNFQTAKSGSNPAVNGPDLTFFTGSGSSQLTMLAYNSVYGSSSAANRAAIMQQVRRYYEPLDITVVELTATPQVINGFTFVAAANLADVSKTLGMNEGLAKNNDSYGFVGVGILDGADLLSDFGIAGIASGLDLNVKANNRDDTNLTFISPLALNSTVYDGDTVAHESGHNFGLQHVYRTGGFTIPGQNWLQLSNSEIMSYNRATSGSSDALTMFSRFPTILGDNNSNPNVLSVNAPNKGTFEQLLNDPSVGANAAFNYVSGTGANDIITITKTGSNAATVSVEPFGNNTYTSALTVPNLGGTSYTYNITLDRPITVDAGPGDDRLVIANNLGVTVRYRGMAGIDSLVVTDAGNKTTTFTPGSNKTASLDTSADFRATLTFGTTTVDILELDKTSTVTVNNAGTTKYLTPGGIDAIAAAGGAGGTITVSGTVAGVGVANVGAISLVLNGAKSLAFNLGNNDAAAVNDSLSLNFAAGSPIPAGGLSYDGGTGIDSISVSADTNFTLSNASLGLGALGTVALANVESATLTGGASANLFTLTGWSGSAVVDGGTGTDTIKYSQDSNMTLVPTKLSTSTGSVVQLASIENAELTGGAADNTFDLSAWLGTAKVDGGGGTDTLRLTRNANFTATDALISVSDGTSYAVTSVERAELIGGAGNNLFDFNAWTGGGALDGLAGADEVRVTRDADFMLLANSLSISVGLPISIANLEKATLTGGASDNVFVVDGWNGNANLDGLGGKNTYRITPGTALSTIVVNDTGGSGTNAVEILGTAGPDSYTIEPDAVISGMQRVQYAGVQSVLVDGRAGDDTFINDINKGFFKGGVLEGGTGLNTFAIIGTPVATIKQSGVRFTGTTTGVILLDPDGSITPSLTGPLTGDETVIPFSNMSKIGDVTPADRFDFVFAATGDAIAVTNGGTFDGSQTVQAFDGTRGVAVARKTRVVISGGGGTDSFTVDTSAIVPGVATFDLLGGTGVDSFTVKASKLAVNLFGGANDDSFSLGGPAGLDAVTGAVAIDGGTGANSVTLNDAGSASANVNVVISATGATGLAGTGATAVTFVAGTVASLFVTGATNFANAVSVSALGFPLVLTTGAKDDSVTLAALGATASVSTGAGNDTVRINGLSVGLSLLTQDDNDTVSFNAPSAATPGSLDSFTAPFAFDAGAGTDAVIFNDAADATGNAYSVGPTAFTRSGGVNFSYANVESAVLFGGGTGDNTYAVTGLANGVAVTDGIGNAMFAIAGDTLAGANSFAGNDGNDAIAFTGSGLTASATVDGGAGTDKASTFATPGADALAVNVGTAGGGSLTGAGAGTLTFLALESLSVDGLGGSNSLAYNDVSGTAVKVAYVPTNAHSGGVSGPVGTTAVAFANANQSFTFNGGPNPDSLTVYGVSTTGSGSGTETTAANGVDTVSISDALVTIQNATLGLLRSVTIAANAGVPSAGTLIVRTGSELTSPADQVAVTPSTKTSIFVYGGGPTNLPGDKIVVNTSGPRSVSLDTDPQGKPITRVTQLSNGATVGFAQFETAPRPELVIVGSGPGSPSRVQTYDASTGNLKLDFSPFGADFRGGVSVATGDVTGDNFPDLIVSAGPGGAPQVNVYDGITGNLLAAFLAYDASFNGGVQVAAGDVNGDGFADIIIGSGIGGGPHVQAVSGKDFGTRLLNFFAYDPSFRNGVQVAAGDLDGDGRAEIVTGAGPGGGPHVRAFSALDGHELANFFAFDPNFRGGVNVAVADLNGDGTADIVAAPGSGGGTQVYLYTPAGTLQASFNAATASGAILPIAREDGVRLGTADLDGDGVRDLVTARGRGTRPIVTGFKLGSSSGPVALEVLRTQSVFDLSFTGGVFVG